MSLTSYLPAWAYLEELRNVREEISKMDINDPQKLFEIGGRLAFLESQVRGDNEYASEQLRKATSLFVDSAYESSLQKGHSMKAVFEKLGLPKLNKKSVLEYVDIALGDIENREKNR